jgi:hypothetical protein
MDNDVLELLLLKVAPVVFAILFVAIFFSKERRRIARVLSVLSQASWLGVLFTESLVIHSMCLVSCIVSLVLLDINTSKRKVLFKGTTNVTAKH